MHGYYQIKRAFVTMLVLLLATVPARSQSDASVNVTASDFTIPAGSAIDSNANAVILATTGSLEFVGNKHNWVSYEYKVTSKIKILNRKAYDLALVKILLYGRNDRQDKLTDLKASTFNLMDGKVIETRLDAKDLYNTELSKNISEAKFTLPAVQEGSIIAYSYLITSYHYYYLPTWNFQNAQYPCLYSAFQIGIPDLLRYLTIRYGVDSFYETKSKDDFKTLQMDAVQVATTIHHHSWIMKDIPSFKDEDYINEPGDYLDKLQFTLVQTYNGEDIDNITTNWKVAEDKLLATAEFAGAVNVDNASNLHNTMVKICTSDGDENTAARQIYNYVHDNFTCVPNDDIFLEHDLYEVNKLKKGSVAEINLLLVALLKQHGLIASPVILSTKDYGKHPENYPVIEKFNYVVCRVRTGKNMVYLDATDPTIGYGKLPLACYNGHAQIIDEQHSGSVYFYPGDITETNKTFVTIMNDEKGEGATASYQYIPGYYHSYDVRNTIRKNGRNQYFKDIQQSYGPDVTIGNFGIDSLDQLEMPVQITYDVSLHYDEGNLVYFNPFISNHFQENPFKAQVRQYPVEMPYPLDDKYELTMEIPGGYVVEELPRPVKVSFNDNEGFFEYIIQKDESGIRLRSHIKLNQATFAPGDYASLRDFFAYVVRKQSEQIVFKKK
ncbi:MAG: DUF3857 domain-containing protein [Ginsengibacter sp.]